MKKYATRKRTCLLICKYRRQADTLGVTGLGVGGQQGSKAPAVVVMKSKRNCREDDTDAGEGEMENG